ncbi:MAG: translation initiation factor IF-3 [Holosporaceae bacterium]|nr:translation initiation factor IF-3 [Holosporaceae bacterium]
MKDNRFAEEKYKLNGAITASEVRLIDQDGHLIGVVSKQEALKMAAEMDLDLVEIAPQNTPPVCKIINYGKLKYELQKKKSEAKKKQKIIEMKEMKFTPTIAFHDYQVKFNNICRFLREGNKVKVTLRLRGREISHQDIGVRVLNRLVDDLKDIAKCEGTPHLEGKQLMLILLPLTIK